MKVDQYLPPGSVSGAPQQAAWAEKIGFHGLFSNDTSHDPFLPIAAAAPATSRIELGTAIAVAFGRSPMTVAYSAWDLAELTHGRFLLGLGTQVRAHITRRFNMPWSSPGPRLREYIQALRAIWNTWQTGDQLAFKGDFYEFSLMTPFFSPSAMEHWQIPVYIAAVGDYMCQVAGEVTDGLHIHPFHTVRYLDDVVAPNVAEGAARAGRSVDDIEMVATAFVISGRNEQEMATSKLAAQLQIAFYASTPSYRAVLDLHGWDFGPELTAMSKRGEWMAMGEVISDEVIDELCVTAPLDELGAAVRAKYDDRVDRIGFYFTDIPNQPPVLTLTEEEWAALISGVQG